MKRFREDLISWYEKNRRALPWRSTSDPYGIWVSEVMLQQTQVKTVIPYYNRFMAGFPDPKLLAAAPLEKVLKLWEGLGYYARARNLHRAAREITARYGGVLPANFKDLKALPGIGDYIAAAVSSIAFGQPHAAVDGNVKRVLARYQMMDIPINAPQSNRPFHAAAGALLDRSNSGTFNQALMELGALICTPANPDCAHCPLASTCRAFKEKAVQHYPKRIRKPKGPLHHIAVGIVWKNERVLITKRKAEGLLGGLWEFPGGKVKDGETAREGCTREIKEEVNLIVQPRERITRIHHAYTHFKIVMDVFQCTLTGGRVRLRGPVDFRWIRIDEIDEYPFPGANRKFISLIKPTLEKPIDSTAT